MTGDLRRFEALLRSDFRPFLEKSFGTLAPGQRFVPSWHLEAIAWRLEKVRRGFVRRLIINMPPRSLKSIAASVAFPAFVLGRDPTRRIICVSYSGDLAKKHSNDFRALIEAPWFRKVFPHVSVGQKDSETEIELTSRGYRMATSVGGTLTGRGGDLIIIDDPLKPDDAMSETRRTAANQWFTNTLLSRLDNKQTGAIIIVMQRVHIDDLTGSVLSQSDEWDVLSLPAVAECQMTIPLWDERRHTRVFGDVLSVDREPLKVLEELKLQLGSDAFYAQYQQEPAPPGGSMIKRHWVRRYRELPPAHLRVTILQSWDTASKGGPQNDYSVCTTWVVTKNRDWYLADLWRDRVDYPGLKDAVGAQARLWRPHKVLVEDSSAGTALTQEMRLAYSSIIAVKVDRDKISRMAIASAKFEAGQVLLPEHAPWLPDLEAELFVFPGSRHDDQCDSISQALRDENVSFMNFLTPEIVEEIRRAPPYRRRR